VGWGRPPRCHPIGGFLIPPHQVFQQRAHPFDDHLTSTRLQRPSNRATSVRIGSSKAADGPQPAIENPCAPSLTRTLHGPGCRMGL